MSSGYLRDKAQTLRFATMLTLLAACFLGGGASRLDVLSLVFLQPLAVICAAVFVSVGAPIRWISIRTPLALLLAVAGIMAVQLIPLPPSVWLALPGHGQFADTAIVAGIPQPWRPISLTPDLTLGALVSLAVPFAVLLGYASLTVEQSARLLPYLIGGVVASAVLGLVQVAGGGRSAFYFYDITNFGSPVGVFSNRNHQAVLLAMSWPMLAIWACRPTDPRRQAVTRWISLTLGIFFLPMIMVIGSRAGLLLGVLGLVAAALLWWLHSPRNVTGRYGQLLAPLAVGVGVLVIVAAIALSRDQAIARMTGATANEELRLQYLPILLQIAGDFFPVGAGFGSFDPLFRAYEPFEFLSPQYLNHAHNDLMELLITGGLPALVVLGIFALWLIRRALPLLRGARGKQTIAFAQLGVVILVILLLSSLVDYPLRTPLMAALASLACSWLADSRTSRREQIGGAQ